MIARRRKTFPLRRVTTATPFTRDSESGRLTAAPWWTLALECGHVAERRRGTLPTPRTVRCDDCPETIDPITATPQGEPPMPTNPRVLAAIYGPNGEVLTVTRGNPAPHPYRIRGTANLDVHDLNIPTHVAASRYALRVVHRQCNLGDTENLSTGDQIDITTDSRDVVMALITVFTILANSY